MKFDNENPNDRIFSDVSLTIKVDIPVAFSAHHPSSIAYCMLKNIHLNTSSLEEECQVSKA